MFVGENEWWHQVDCITKRAGEDPRIEEFFSAEEGRMGLVVSFVAILELVRDGLLRLTQNEDLAPIYVQLPDS